MIPFIYYFYIKENKIPSGKIHYKVNSGFAFFSGLNIFTIYTIILLIFRFKSNYDFFVVFTTCYVISVSLTIIYNLKRKQILNKYRNYNYRVTFMMILFYHSLITIFSFLFTIYISKQNNIY